MTVNMAAWINTLTETEKQQYFDTSNVYLKIIDDNVEAFGSPASLKAAGYEISDYDLVIPMDVWTGYSEIVDGTIVIEKNIDILKTEKKDEIALARYIEETSGININGNIISTERESQALIIGAALQALQDPTYVCKWKTNNGFVDLDAATIIQIAVAVRNHVQACFNKESMLIDQIDQATTKEEVESISW